MRNDTGTQHTHPHTLTHSTQHNKTKQNKIHETTKKKKQNKTQYNKTNKHNVECNCYAGYLYEVCAKGSRAMRGERGAGVWVFLKSDEAGESSKL